MSADPFTDPAAIGRAARILRRWIDEAPDRARDRMAQIEGQ